jgi:hypothetical protein
VELKFGLLVRLWLKSRESGGLGGSNEENASNSLAFSQVIEN